MFSNLLNIKGIHPGFILERELKNRNLPKGRFALKLQEFPQTIVSITKGKRKMNTSLALKIEHELDIQEGYFMTLQIFYDIQELKRKKNSILPNLTKLRSVLFWDTDIHKIDWDKQKSAAIKRIFERGNNSEKEEITRFYGSDIVAEILSSDDK